MEVMKMKKPEVEQYEMMLWLLSMKYREDPYMKYKEEPDIPPFDACEVKIARQLQLLRILEAVPVELLRDAASGLVGCERALCGLWGGDGCNLPKS
jgi:hypothetical protein